MLTRRLAPEAWSSYLAAQAPRMRAAPADVHTLDPTRERFARGWGVAVLDVGYDDHAETFYLRTVEFEYRVESPTAISVMEGPAGELRGLEITGPDGLRHVVAVHEVLALPL